MNEFEQRLKQSWIGNAASWTEAVRAGHIESRRLITDAAVVEAVLSCGGSKVLDVGCGEGWLARTLASKGLEVVGFDGSVALVERARELGGASFVALSYDDFAPAPARLGGDYDVTVANFSLLGEHIAPLLKALRQVVTPAGALVIQTVHPHSVDGGDADGWREERFDPLASLAFAPMPWYFRTRDSWLNELEAAGWGEVRAIEPVHPETGRPASLILEATA